MRDDREKQPWNLSYPTKVKRLEVGDYSFDGLEKLVAIEKKSGLIELLNDLTASYRPTFERFLKRLSKVPVRCIVVGEPLSEWRVHKALKIVKEKSRGKRQSIPRTIYYWLGEMMMTYNIPVLFLDPVTREHVLREVFRAAYAKARVLK